MANLPTPDQLIGNSVSEAKFKENLKRTIEFIAELKPYIDSLVINANEGALNNILQDAIDAAAAAGAGANGWTDLLIKTQDGSTQRDINEKSLKNGDYAPVLGSPVKLKLNPIMASFLYGISDPTHKDDNLNNFRGLNHPDAWHESNIGTGGVAFGRNNAPFAYLSTALGHDCVGYGVASLVGGAGSCTGNPDDPNEPTGKYGYCGFVWGKDSQGPGRISNAMGHLNLSESLYSSTDGYNCVAGKALPTHPDYVSEGSEGVCTRAHGYQSKAYGNFAFAYGSFLTAYNGCQLIGKGMTSSKRGVGIGYGVDRPTIFAKEGNGQFAWVGFNTDIPLSKYDHRLEQSDTISYTIDAQGGDSTVVAFEVKGLLGDGKYGSLHNVIVSHTNSGQPYGTVQYRLNGHEYLTVDQTRKAKFSGGVEAGGAGFFVNGKRIVGGQIGAIADLPENASLSDVIVKINTLLAGFREGTGHGLIAK
ncbi:hypothetical protein [Acinetobacter guillouiae]|uniref:hypothetical protein n=1 Tax=Acinetobacter guillouiae TaxID=106649 RepID=UPI001AE7979B|nr:hypothetical protein [Acinetobacter guillouiae]MBP2544862.1 hypothetical protein [Acinetobacter guillouiae]